jgi:hypothetical protein
MKISPVTIFVILVFTCATAAGEPIPNFLLRFSPFLFMAAWLSLVVENYALARDAFRNGYGMIWTGLLVAAVDGTLARYVGDPSCVVLFAVAVVQAGVLVGLVVVYLREQA